MSAVRRSHVIGLSATLIAAGAVAAVPAVASSAPVRPTFSQPMILPGTGAEPSIRVPNDHQSVAYISAPTGAGSNFWRLTKVRNRDGSIYFKSSAPQQPDLGTGGGDSEISVADSADQSTGCDTVAYSGLHNIDLLDNFTVARSTDCGKTFGLTNPYGTQNTLTDRQWQVFDGEKTNFLIFHKVDTGQIVVTESSDGGQTYVSLDPDGERGIIEPQLLTASPQDQQIGNIIVNHAELIKGATNVLSGERVHAMYAIFEIASDASTAVASQSPSATYNGINAVYVGKSIDGGLTWKDTLVYEAPPSTQRELNMLFPVVTADRAGNLYALWSDTWKIQYSVSTDHGAHWSKPYQVNTDNRGWAKSGADRPDPGKADVFPWIAAGAKGLVDVVWYHGEGGGPTSNLFHRDPGDSKTHWTVAMAQLGNANHVSHGVAAPKVLSYSNAITPIIHYGDVCQNGTFCALVPVPGAPYSTGDRSLLDFFQVAIDGDGRANIALADNAKAPGEFITAFSQQVTGYSLTSGQKLKPLKVKFPMPNCDIYGTFKDAAGDADEVGVAGAPPAEAPGLDVRKGWVTWDRAKKVASFHITVTDLKQTPSASSGEDFNFYFGWATKGYVAEGTRDAVNGTSFVLDSNTAGSRATIVKGLTGKFDDAHNEVTINVPANTFTKSSDKAFKGPALRDGAQVTGLTAETRRSYPQALQPVADTGSGLCPATLTTPRSHRSGAVVAGNPSLLPPAPTAARELATSTLPAALVILLLGIAATVVGGRRRGGLAVA